MSSNKILFPQSHPSPKKLVKTKAIRQAQPVKPVLDYSERQLNEGFGLILIGVSAFCLSLLHYLQSSKVMTSVNTLITYFGIGLYIVPIIVGVMGVQLFLERPFRNFRRRLAGTFGFLIFSLGLLGIEGGKIGVAVQLFFSARFSLYPSQIFLGFIALASLIFTLDILYKDLLIALAVVAKFLITACQWCFQGAIYLSAGAVDAAKTSGIFLKGVFQTVWEWLSPGETLEMGAGTCLIPFHPSLEDDNPLPIRVNSGEQVSAPSKSKINPASARNNLSPETLAKAFPSDPNDGSSKAEEIPTVTSFGPCSAPPPLPYPTSPEPTTKSQAESPASGKKEAMSPEPRPRVEEGKISEDREAENSKVPKESDPEQAPDISHKTTTGPLVVRPENEPKNHVSDNSDDDDEEGEGLMEDDLKNQDIPVSLDDHPIDRDLKKVAPETPSQAAAAAKEALLPPLDLLSIPPEREPNADNDLEARSNLLLKTLADFGIQAQVTAVVEGPAVSRFELKPAPGVKVARITSLIDDIALALSAQAIRIEAPIPGKPALGIEIPNPKPTPVFFYELLKHDRFHSKETLMNLALGVTISGRPVFADLAEMPHLLIAGSTGSGKSVCVNTIIASILYQARAHEVKMVMIDPKMVELSSYNGIPHLISPVVTDPKKASAALLWAVEEMERRYECLAGCGVRKISTYNEELPRLRREFDEDLEPMPFIVIIIDELADLMMTASAQVEGSICRLAQMARAVGIHLIIATQRPSVDVITGIIKANLPSRIAFSVASQIDSRTILDSKGAERLLGKGDMLFVPKGKNKPIRIQGAFISDRELASITEWVKTQGSPEYIDIAPTKDEDEEEKNSEPEIMDEDDDSRLLGIIEDYLATQEKTSTSMLQRKFKIGYNRAARIMDILEEKGFVSPLDGSNKRRVIGRRSSPKS